MTSLLNAARMFRLLSIAAMLAASIGCQSTARMTPAEIAAQKMRAVIPVKFKRNLLVNVIEYLKTNTKLNRSYSRTLAFTRDIRARGIRA